MPASPLFVLDHAVDVTRRLSEAGIDNAIGGAIALAFHVGEPRGTRDIDVNVSLPTSEARRALELLPDEVPWDDESLARIERDGYVRLWWPVDGELPVPLDLFFIEHEFHEVVRTRTVTVSLRGVDVPILSATDLTVFKALFDRTKDWADIEAMVEESVESFDVDEAIRWVAAIVGEGDRRTQRLQGLRSRPL